MSNRILIITLVAISFSQFVFAQADRRDVRRGNKLYRAEKFDEAEIPYRRAIENNPQNLTGMFNLGNSLYKQGRYDEAAQIFESIAQISPDFREKAQAFHNLGNSHLRGQKLKESVDAYKNSLRLNPNDNETRHNLAYALKLLQDQPPQDSDGEGDDDDKKYEQQDKQEKEREQDKNNQQQQQQQQPGQISPQDAERILNALNQQEQKIQEDLNREQPQRNVVRPEREW